MHLISLTMSHVSLAVICLTPRRQLFVLYDCARPRESVQTLSTAGPASPDEATEKCKFITSPMRRSLPSCFHRVAAGLAMLSIRRVPRRRRSWSDHNGLLMRCRSVIHCIVRVAPSVNDPTAWTGARKHRCIYTSILLTIYRAHYHRRIVRIITEKTRDVLIFLYLSGLAKSNNNNSTNDYIANDGY